MGGLSNFYTTIYQYFLTFRSKSLESVRKDKNRGSESVKCRIFASTRLGRTVHGSEYQVDDSDIQTWNESERVVQ